MVCVIDFDGTYFRNDFFKELFFKKIIDNPFFLVKHFLFKRGNWVDLKKNLLNDVQIRYDTNFLVNPKVHDWIITNKESYNKVVVVSASPDVFVKNMLTSRNVFDEVHGSTSKNLKGSEKLQFITEHWGNEFIYFGDSRDDIPIFQKAKTAYKVKVEEPTVDKLFHYFKLMRPTNWVKNFLIGFPFILSGNYTIGSSLNVLIGIIAFSLLASGGYIINDIRDIDKDRLHTKKINRPLASGVVRVDKAFMLAFALIASAFIINLYFDILPFLILLAYFSLNYFYSIYGKRMRFMDVILLSSFYIIRVMYGSEICDTQLTGWFMATLTFSVLALSISKRYMECVMTSKNKVPGRGYTKEDQLILYSLMFNFTTASIILLNIHAYFVLSIKSPYFYFLLNLAAAGIAFFYFDHSKNKSDDPVDRILKNKKLLLLLLLFIGLYTYEVIIKIK